MTKQAAAPVWQSTKEKVQRAAYRQARQAIERRRNPRLKITFSDRPAPSTLYFLTPDYDIPSGGIRVIYRHVDILNEAGIKAMVLHQRKGFRCTWFANQTAITDVHTSAVGPGDVLVVSELHVEQLNALPPGIRHIVLNQNAHLTWRQHADLVGDHYAHSPDLLGIIVVSEHNAELLRYVYPERTIHRVRNGLDSAIFHLPAEPKARRLACFPRRGQQDLTMVLQILRARRALDGWEVFPLDSLDQAAFGAGLRTSAITLSLSYQEGFGLPGAEAMACGNYVIGYHALAGREYMRPEFSATVEAGDVMTVAAVTANAIAEEDQDEGWCLARGQLASAFVLDQYSTERERDSVVAAYRDLLARG